MRRHFESIWFQSGVPKVGACDGQSVANWDGTSGKWVHTVHRSGHRTPNLGIPVINGAGGCRGFAPLGRCDIIAGGSRRASTEREIRGRCLGSLDAGGNVSTAIAVPCPARICRFWRWTRYLWPPLMPIRLQIPYVADTPLGRPGTEHAWPVWGSITLRVSNLARRQHQCPSIAFRA